jgi:polar amino acid transport system permease protein
MTYEWDFSQIFNDPDVWIEGLKGTVQLALAGLAIAVPVGLLLALLRISRIPVISYVVVWYINLVRAIPALVLIFWFFFALPVMAGVQMGELQAASFALGFQGAAFFAEVFRAGIQSVAHGQKEAGKASALTNRQIFVEIILPQAIRNSLPVLVTMTIELTKGTALAGSVGFPELAYKASELANRTYRPLEVYTTLALFYLVVISLMSHAGRILERRLSNSQHKAER